MSDEWTWEYNPDAEHVVGGLPPEAVAEVERLARELCVLGRDAAEVGRGRTLRVLPILGGRGLLTFMPYERGRSIVLLSVLWNG